MFVLVCLVYFQEGPRLQEDPQDSFLLFPQDSIDFLLSSACGREKRDQQRSGIDARRGRHGVGRCSNERGVRNAARGRGTSRSNGVHLTGEQDAKSARSEEGRVGALRWQDTGGRGRGGRVK